mmetsp:Transcript_33931/g.95358  ORF Transcript_33931/g.95358 Transcript_33931/m.95358 type:complete len:263 (+) Transcript_33931:703-1491(+)
MHGLVRGSQAPVQLSRDCSHLAAPGARRVPEEAARVAGRMGFLFTRRGGWPGHCASDRAGSAMSHVDGQEGVEEAVCPRGADRRGGQRGVQGAHERGGRVHGVAAVRHEVRRDARGRSAGGLGGPADALPAPAPGQVAARELAAAVRAQVRGAGAGQPLHRVAGVRPPELLPGLAEDDAPDLRPLVRRGSHGRAREVRPGLRVRGAPALHLAGTGPGREGREPDQARPRERRLGLPAELPPGCQLDAGARAHPGAARRGRHR